MRDILRTVRLRPYLKGHGPTFTLITWDTGRRHSRGTTMIGYELKQHENSKTTVLFTGEDFSASPSYADDSDRAVAALLSFLTLRPGDTDSEYFADYTEAQLEFASQHAESLSCASMDRFGEDYR